jgi:murein DD-endopeptidase MepM/ murein hydrolase activator NlpD
VVRNFPRATRRRVTAVVATFGMLLSVATVQLAVADDLKDRKRRVQGNITKAERHLDQSSDRLARTTKALEAAEARLAEAERALDTARTQLAAAELVDQRMQAALDAAVRELEEARVALANGTDRVRRQERALGQVAVQSYQLGGPGMLGLSMVLTSTDPAELTSQLNSVRSVLDKQSVTLDRLKASKVLLVIQEQKVEAAKDEVAVRRQAAAENLELKQALEAAADAAEERVAGLVAARADARRAAAAARAEDARQLRQLKKERAEISQLLRERAREARRRAAARAERERARAERERERNQNSQSNQDSQGGNGGQAQGFLSYPVQTYITSQYGMRLHPIYHQWRLHDGTDFGAGCGTPIRAAASGQVVGMYYNVGYGNRVIIDHGYHAGAGVATAYNHLSRYSAYVGQRVSRGDIIGYVGTTGYSTGCHLHFMVFRNGRTVNPMSYL